MNTLQNPLLICLVLMSNSNLAGQSTDWRIGKYVQKTDERLLLIGELTLRPDSTFKYRSIGTLRDSAEGKFTIESDTVTLKYFDGYIGNPRNEIARPTLQTPIELLGPILQTSNRPIRLVKVANSNELFSLTTGDSTKNIPYSLSH